jgi:hypothetical protein
MLTPFERAFIAHLIGDWLLQNDWMAHHKHKLHHPAAWVHGIIQGVLLGCALGLTAGVVLGVIHILIDTRAPLRWWSRIYAKANSGSMGEHVTIWADQVLHLGCIAMWIVWFGIA